MDSKWLWIAAAAVGAYALYEWLQTQCATSGSDFYGGSLCSSLFPTTTVAAAATVATAASSSQATILAAYGLPADAVPSSTFPSGQTCSVVSPAQSGYNPVPGAPFYSPSLGQYLCGPATLWQSMSAPALVAPVTPVTANPIIAPVSLPLTAPGNTIAPVVPPATEWSQWNAGPQPGTVIIIRRGGTPTGCLAGESSCPLGVPVLGTSGGSNTPTTTPTAGTSGLNRIPARLIHRRIA
jgi:hypothetical protein